MTADILRLVAGGLLALICCYAGVLIKRHYSEREKFYTDAEAFAAYLSSELGFKKTALPLLIETFRKERAGSFSAVLEKFSSMLASLGQDGAASAAAESSKLKREEKSRLAEFLSALGKTSLCDQLEHARRAEAEFSARRIACAEESKRLGGMYFKLAVLLGIALILILA